MGAAEEVVPHRYAADRATTTDATTATATATAASTSATTTAVRRGDTATRGER